MQTLTRKEEQIMQAVWQIGHPCLISEILKKDTTLKRNTVAPGIITLTKKRISESRFHRKIHDPYRKSVCTDCYPACL